MKAKLWTPYEAKLVEKHLGTLRLPEIAKKLGRTIGELTNYMRRQKLRTPPRWTAAQKQAVIDADGQLTAVQLARVLGLPLKKVYQMRWRLGLTRCRIPRDGAFVRFLQDRHADGWSDAEIAAAYTALYLQTHPGLQPLDRHTVGQTRARLGLASNRNSEHQRRRVAAKTAEQIKKAGLPSIGHLRVEAFRKRAREAGWPEDLRPRAVQILNAIWDRGPMTRREIADAIGMPWKGSRNSLVSNDPEGSYLAHLTARGLVVVFQRACRVTGRGKGRSLNVYSLSPEIQRRKPTTGKTTGKANEHVEQTESRFPGHAGSARDEGADRGPDGTAPLAESDPHLAVGIDQARGPGRDHVGPGGQGQGGRRDLGQVRAGTGPQAAVVRPPAGEHHAEQLLRPV